MDDKLARVPEEVLLLIAAFVSESGLRDGPGDEGVVERICRRIRALSETSTTLRAACMAVVRPALALAMRLALPQTVRTSTMLACMLKDSVLAGDLLRENAHHLESAAILSRLVDLSHAAAIARAHVAAARRLRRPDAAARSERALNEVIVPLIESARPALRSSLGRATVRSERMYRDHHMVADAAIERLKIRPYQPVDQALRAGMQIRHLVDRFVRDAHRDRAWMTETLGPLCLWDVSSTHDMDGACAYLRFDSDLFWNTGSVTSMREMLCGNEEFRGYVGTWDVSSVECMFGMFDSTAIEDSGIGNWNTASLTDAGYMLSNAQHLSRCLDLSGWKFGPSPSMRGMFARSAIADCGIGEWDVTNADTWGMLSEANDFTGYMRLMQKWPAEKSEDADVPAERQRSFGGVGFGLARTRTIHTIIARAFADALRRRDNHKRTAKKWVILNANERGLRCGRGRGG
jgi:hypothetical protein